MTDEFTLYPSRAGHDELAEFGGVGLLVLD